MDGLSEAAEANCHFQAHAGPSSNQMRGFVSVSEGALPGAEIVYLCLGALDVLIIALALFSRGVDGRLQATSIIVVKRHKLERLLVPGHWAEHLRQREHRPGGRQEHELGD